MINISIGVIPWKTGRPVVWDATCSIALAPSQLPETMQQAGGASTTNDANIRLFE